ncbi:unnamed protein product [Darwinula stevensoni]|uniref:Kringle domain-containing protein n=1 Tax=Darwinula stevensoni TaxID=69355 RepID=A0A7R8XCC3_9CRUS|nr:unnamed protein product [Darwinula stevensoni]CAG0885709.1 unnamed protein product [Darwinula stevensoni]
MTHFTPNARQTVTREPPECKLTELGTEYIGRQNMDVSGSRCTPWEFVFSSLTDMYQAIPDSKGMEKEHNFCRNPYGEFDVPFCYVNKELKACDVPFCPDILEDTTGNVGNEGNVYPECLLSKKGKEYVGTMSITETGKDCLLWANQVDDMPWDFYMTQFKPKDNSWEKSYNGYEKRYLFLNGDVKIHKNYCRNPGPNRKKPWCFVAGVDVKWEYCDIPFCHDMNSPNCKLTAMGGEYVGKLNVTISGLSCQPWVTTFSASERLNYAATSMFPEEIDSTNNFCRSPNLNDPNWRSPWCYIEPLPQGKWEFCDVPFCLTNEECDIRVEGKCVDIGMDEHNLCRNPNGEFDVPFCYADGEMKACDVPFCPGVLEDIRANVGIERNVYPECLLSTKGKENT